MSVAEVGVGAGVSYCRRFFCGAGQNHLWRTLRREGLSLINESKRAQAKYDVFFCWVVAKGERRKSAE